MHVRGHCSVGALALVACSSHAVRTTLSPEFESVCVAGDKYVPIWSADGGMIAFSLHASDSTRAHVLDLDDGAIRRLPVDAQTRVSAFVGNVDSVLTWAERDGSGEISVRSLKSGTGRVLHRDENAMLIYPSISPDGSTLAFMRHEGPSRFHLYVSRDGAAPRRLAGSDGTIFARPASWAPGGDWLAFSDASGGDAEIHLARLEGPDLIRLTEHAGPDLNPSLSPDGEWIAFIRRNAEVQGEENNRIFLMRRDGGGVRQLSAISPMHGSLTWSPSGEWLAFNARTGETTEIMAVRFEDALVVALTCSPADAGN